MEEYSEVGGYAGISCFVAACAVTPGIDATMFNGKDY